MEVEYVLTGEAGLCKEIGYSIAWRSLRGSLSGDLRGVTAKVNSVNTSTCPLYKCNFAKTSSTKSNIFPPRLLLLHGPRGHSTRRQLPPDVINCRPCVAGPLVNAGYSRHILRPWSLRYAKRWQICFAIVSSFIRALLALLAQ